MSTHSSGEPTAGSGPGSEHLETLVEIGNSLANVISATTAFQRVLDILERRWGAVRGAVSLLDPKSGEISIRASHGLSASGRTARYSLGEGVLGRVVESGCPIVVPRISQEPTFLNRAGQRKRSDKSDLAYVCVPILIDRRPVGAIGVDLAYENNRDYRALLSCLRVAACMMAQSIKADHLADHLVDEERRRLIDENSRLLGELRERYDFSGLIGTTGVVEGRRLPPTLQTARSTGTMPGQSFADAVEAFERDLLLDALKTTRGNRAKAARLLGTTPRILNYKVRKYQINHRVPSVWRPESVRK